MYDLYDSHFCGIHCTDTKTQNLRAFVMFYSLSEVKVIPLKKQVEYKQSSLGPVVICNFKKVMNMWFAQKLRTVFLIRV